jgi:hypothetical protein
VCRNREAIHLDIGHGAKLEQSDKPCRFLSLGAGTHRLGPAGFRCWLAWRLLQRLGYV